jgi:hypothetical protein
VSGSLEENRIDVLHLGLLKACWQEVNGTNGTKLYATVRHRQRMISWICLMFSNGSISISLGAMNCLYCEEVFEKSNYLKLENISSM